jgi:uncharacterized Ntn-hydrolase superfamily protein
MTYSIVARDPETGELGVAVQSHYFTVGPIVPWLQAGVGAVATQSFVEPAYGLRGLARMADGDAAPAALEALVADDEARDVRQVAMVDAAGRVAAHTGAKCIADAGHRVGDAFSVQANMMRRPSVPDAMFEAYASSTAPLAERLVAALVAAEGEGGDIRGKQSAAIRIVRGTSGDDPWNDVVLDLRVDDHPDPNTELARLVRMHRAYARLNESERLRVDEQIPEADAEAEAALALLPESIEIGFWHGVQLCIDGRDAEARPLLDRAYAVDDGWRELVRRLPAAGLLADDPALVARIVGGGA